MKKFHISDILTVTTGKMVSIRGMEGLYDILNYMSEDNLHTHQLPRVMEECAPFLIKQFPQFKGFEVTDWNEQNHLSKVEALEEAFGRYHEVKRLPEGVHKKLNPIAEMIMLQNRESESQ